MSERRDGSPVCYTNGRPLSVVSGLALVLDSTFVYPTHTLAAPFQTEALNFDTVFRTHLNRPSMGTAHRMPAPVKIRMPTAAIIPSDHTQGLSNIVLLGLIKHVSIIRSGQQDSSSWPKTRMPIPRFRSRTTMGSISCYHTQTYTYNFSLRKYKLTPEYI